MWSQEHYQYILFAFGLFAWLAISRAGELMPTSGQRLRWFSRASCIAMAISLVLLGNLTQSSLPGYLGVVIACGALLDLWREKGTQHSMAYLTPLLLVTARLPLRLDQNLIVSLQTLTSQISSRILDSLGVVHILTGNVIETLDGTKLLVEEACSGVQSLFTLIFIATAITVIRRHAFSRFVLLSVSAVLWAVLMNTLRVVTISLALSWMNVDLTSGWRHDLVGHFAMAAAAGLLFSSDRLMDFALNPMPAVTLKHKMLNPFVAMWNFLFSPYASPSKVAASRTVTPLLLTVGLPLSAVLPLSAASLMLAPDLARSPDSQSNQTLVTTTIADHCKHLQSEVFHANATIIDFEEIARDAGSQFGAFSHIWQIKERNKKVRHAVDYPFIGWHDLSTCYVSIGWERLESEEFSESSDGKWPGIIFRLQQPSGEYAYLCLSMLTFDGDYILPESRGDFFTSMKGRFAIQHNGERPTLQLQTMHASLVQLDKEQVDQLKDLHLQFRNRLKQELCDTDAAVANATIENGADR